MQLVYGVGLAGVGILLLMAGMRLVRGPRPPRWLQEGVVGDLLVVTVMGFLVMGGGLTIRFIATLPAQSFGLGEALWVGFLLASLFVGVRLLRARAPRPAEAPAEAAAGATVVSLPTNSDPSPNLPRPSGRPAGRGRGKRAA